MRVTEPLRATHTGLLPHIEELRSAAELVGDADWATLRAAVDRNVAFLEAHLLPHIATEDLVIYPTVDRVVGSPATATMRREHGEITALVTELRGVAALLAKAPLDDRQSRGLRRILYGLYTLVKVHVGNEENVLLSLLDERLTPAEAAALFGSLHRAGNGGAVAPARG